ncbi:MAG TPA: hypothetical protein VFC92_03530 [Bacteroidales bacterium]|nr:hypothetical protein [Bacteroidales bacterium]
MKSTKTFFIATLTLLILLIVVSCEKENNNQRPDFRTEYLGNFNFKVVSEFWTVNPVPPIYDTSFYNGVIRKYELIDSEDDYYNDDDSHENPNEKITLIFSPNKKITSLINKNGILTTRSGIHYLHHGKFMHLDTIEFYVGIGGLGGGRNYEVKGIRNN